MKDRLPIALIALLVLIAGFLIAWNFLPEKTTSELIFRQAKVSAASDVSGYSLKLALPENLERYLEGFGFWQEEGVFLRSQDKKATAKRLVVHLTNKDQPFDKLINPESQKLITSTGEALGDDGTYHLSIFIPPEALENAPLDNLLQAFEGYVLRSAYTITHYDPALSPEQNKEAIEEESGIVNEILWLLGKTRIFEIKRS